MWRVWTAGTTYISLLYKAFAYTCITFDNLTLWWIIHKSSQAILMLRMPYVWDWTCVNMTICISISDTFIHMKLKFYCCTHVYFVVFVVMWLLFNSAVNFILHQSEYVYCITTCLHVCMVIFVLLPWRNGCTKSVKKCF